MELAVFRWAIASIPFFAGLFMLMLEGDKYPWKQNRKLIGAMLVALMGVFFVAPQLYQFCINQGVTVDAANKILLVTAIIIAVGMLLFAHIVLRWANSPRGTK